MHFLNRSQVHKVTRRSDGAACAVSIVRKGKGDKTNRELKVLHSLRSEFVVQLLEWATVGNDVLLVVEFLEGKVLTDEIAIGVGVEDEIVLWRWAEGIMQGVVSFHSQNIAHHNIRPSNVSRVSPLSAVAPAGPCHRPRRRRLPPRNETEAYDWYRVGLCLPRYELRLMGTPRLPTLGSWTLLSNRVHRMALSLEI
jgi:serine/threonine protein kinase